MRAQGSGHVLQVSSVGAIAPLPDLGLYSASKFALEGLSQSLAAEVARFGIRVTLLQPGSYATGWAASAGRARALPAYAAAHEEASAFWTSLQQAQGDPRTTREVVRGLVDEAEPPLRVLLGEGALAVATEEHERRLASWRAGARLSVS
jgi:NAD(P)-dependent dehydrogenase (short-subunit alcohol dehydrogenase family)